MTRALLAQRAEPSQVEPLQRSRGDVRLAFGRRRDVSVLRDLYQSGSAKVRFARVEPGTAPEAILINTAGGLTDGDQLTHDVRWREGATAVVTSQAAERIYRSRSEPAVIRTRLAVEDGATAVWIPQETILFDGARLDRLNEAELAPGARLLACESLVFGRAAMGETVRGGFVSDSWRIRLNGKLLFADCFRLDGPIERLLKRPALGEGAGAVATVLYAGPDAQAMRDSARGCLDEATVRAGSTCLGLVNVVRLVARSAFELRKALIRVLSQLMARLDPNEAVGLPRVWSL